jgi:hypothetical protein
MRRQASQVAALCDRMVYLPAALMDDEIKLDAGIYQEVTTCLRRFKRFLPSGVVPWLGAGRCQRGIRNVLQLKALHEHAMPNGIAELMRGRVVFLAGEQDS